MGNCLRNNKISSQDHDSYEASVIEARDELRKTCPLSKLETPRKEQSMKKVRFKLQNDIDEGDRGSHGDSRSGSVRIRLVMTQEELKRMLSCKDDAKHTTLEQLLGAVKLRGGRISGVGEHEHDGGINSWRPALESIPENY
ncbi:uncharacterized protein LOC113860106 [Abrus precatorius]|uniref:Uncharacterized protein LOC113860106 n=1 Tax=Abrus precatorius TaxID=3816 RepID=A0A8B8L1N9_ABRPR|nr:uncharacterized protein LOC113860106 [Abrus precatorius]